MPPLDAWLSEAESLLAATRRSGLGPAMDRAVSATARALAAGRPLLVCGNGGSAADAQHIVAELVGRFLRDRRALRAICLSSDAAILTAWSNDQGFDTVFARQVEAHAEPGGVLLALSTSGNSPNVVKALEAARATRHDDDRPDGGGRRPHGAALRPPLRRALDLHARDPAGPSLPLPLLLRRRGGGDRGRHGGGVTLHAAVPPPFSTATAC